MLESVALQAATEFDRAGHAYPVPMLALPSHVRKLSRTLIALENSASALGGVSLAGVYSLLNVAGALEDVTANTAIDDSSIYYCGSALEFADAESAIASKYLAGTIMFNFAWMALEQTILEVSPAGKGTAGARGRIVFSQPMTVDVDLDGPLKLAWSSAREAKDMEDDLRRLAELLPSALRPEVAFELVRRVRNAFAHGRLIPPQPKDWSEKASPTSHPEVDRFFACTRLALLLIAMLLANKIGTGMMECHPEDRPYLEDSDDDLEKVSVTWALQTAHYADPWLPPEVGASQMLELIHG